MNRLEVLLNFDHIQHVLGFYLTLLKVDDNEPVNSIFEDNEWSFLSSITLNNILFRDDVAFCLLGGVYNLDFSTRANFKLIFAVFDVP